MIHETAETRSDPDSGDCYDTPPPESAPLPAGPFAAGQDETVPVACGPGSPGGLPLVPGYEVLSELGRGGMGVVYRARHLALKRTVALKMLLPGVVTSATLLDRFRIESESAARLQHPNIVRVYEVGEANRQPFIVMEYVTGGCLAAHLAGGPMPPAAAAAVVAVLARAADYAHRTGVVHRDLKPSNVLLEAGDAASPWAVELLPGGGRVTPKISDFSLAKCLDSDDGHTRTGAILGTPCYMAPEQAGGGGSVAGPAADVYSLGVILYEALTGRVPFRGPTVLETLDQVRKAPPPPPEQFQPRLPRDLRTVCLKCLEKFPGSRYASAADLAADLERLALGEPILARPVGAAERAVRWAKRRPTAAALVLAGLVGLGGSLVGLLVHNDRLRGEVERTQLQEAATRREKAAALDHVRRGHEALDDIFTSLDNGPVGVSGNAAYWAMYREQAEAILRYYRDILREGDDADPEVRFHRGLVSVYSGRMQLRLQNWQAAEADFRLGHELLGPLAAAPDAPVGHRREYAQCCYWLGTYLFLVVRHEDARAEYGRALDTAGALEVAGAAEDRDRRVLALTHNRLAELEELAKRPGAVERHALEALARWDVLIAADPENEIHRVWAVKALRLVALAQLQPDNREKLDAVHPRAAAAAAWYADRKLQRAAGSTGRTELSEVYHILANALAARGDPGTAVERVTDAIGLAEVVLRAEPAAAAGRTAMATLYRDRAMFLAGVGRGAEAFPDWDRAVVLAEGDSALGYRLERAAARLEGGGIEAAVVELTDTAAQESLTATQSAEAGRLFAHVVAALGADDALPPDDRTRRQDEAAAHAVGCIRRAVEKGGFKDVEAFRTYTGNPVIADTGARPALRGRFDELERQIAARKK